MIYGCDWEINGADTRFMKLSKIKRVGKDVTFFGSTARTVSDSKYLLRQAAEHWMSMNRMLMHGVDSFMLVLDDEYV